MCFSETNFPLISVLIIQFILHLPHFMWPWNVIMSKWCNIYFYAFLLFIPRKEFLFHKKTLEMKNDFLMSSSNIGLYTKSIAVNLLRCCVSKTNLLHLPFTLSDTVLIYPTTQNTWMCMCGWLYKRHRIQPYIHQTYQKLNKST